MIRDSQCNCEDGISVSDGYSVGKSDVGGNGDGSDDGECDFDGDNYSDGDDDFNGDGDGDVEDACDKLVNFLSSGKERQSVTRQRLLWSLQTNFCCSHLPSGDDGK